MLARVAAFAMTLKSARKLTFQTLSQTWITYSQSVLSQSVGDLHGAAPKAGDRFLWLNLQLNDVGTAVDLYQALDDRCFNLLIFGADDGDTN
ncbi:MAG: hypothetical protein AB7L90_09220 [Hyphomicrobiaceae bacterium]